MGYYTYPISPLDLCALAVPASIRPDGLPFSLQLIAAPLHDGLLRAVGERFAAEARVPPGTDVLR